ncbi:MAG: choice-of-anchor D domain-containing protein [Clostridiaceae bacterium]|nr:choice-of-anchor D domain-containing protein [Clostridiaceae bacterium]
MTRRFLSVLIAIVFTLSMMLCGTGTVLADENLDTPNAPIVVSEEQHDFGLQDIGRSSGPYMFTIRNISSQPVKISSIEFSGEHSSDFVKVNDYISKGTIEPGQYREFFVAFSPTSEGRKTADIIITYDETDPKTVTISLSGTGIPIIPEERGTIKGVIKNQYGEDYNGTLLLYDAETGKRIGISSDPKIGGLIAEGEYTIENILPGRYKLYYESPYIKYIYQVYIPNIWYNDANSFESATEIEVIAGNVTEGIDFTVPVPLLLTGIKDQNFGKVEVGSSKEIFIRIGSLEGAPNYIDSVTLAGPDKDQFSIINDTITGQELGITGQQPGIPPTEKGLTIAFTPTSPGKKTAEIQIIHNNRVNWPVIIVLEGTGVDSEPSKYDMRQYGVLPEFNMDSLQSGKMLNAEVNVTNFTNAQEAVLVIVALYDEDNRMVNVSYISKEIGAGLTEKLRAGFKLPDDTKNHKVRVFVWDGRSITETNMQALSDVFELK